MILTPKPNSALKTLLCGALALFFAMPAPAQGKSDDVLLEMQQAFRKGDKKRLATLLPQARGHVLEPWAAYWELKARLGEASALEVQDFLTRYAGTYQEDRMRNDWLQLLGQRRDWTNFAAEHPNYRMSDDREVRCYALLVDHLKNPVLDARLSDEVRKNWYAQRDADDGCTSAAERLVGSKNLAPLDVWKKARMATEANRPRAARDAVQIVAPEAVGLVTDLNANPAKFLSTKYLALRTVRKEIITLALIKLATSDTDAAIEQLKGKWAPQLTAEERNWIWGVIGKQAAGRLSDAAPRLLRQRHPGRRPQRRPAGLESTRRAAPRPMARRAGSHPCHERGRSRRSGLGLLARTGLARRHPAGTACPARGRHNNRCGSSAAAPQGRIPGGAPAAGVHRLGARGFYEKLALEELGQRIHGAAQARQRSPPPRRKRPARTPAWPARCTRSSIGLRSEGVREWNYSVGLHDQGRHERPGAAGRCRPRLPARSLGPLHQHQRPHPADRPGAAFPHAAPRRGGGACRESQPRSRPSSTA
jgi:soluble lytic murein transglycosylase